MTWDRVEDWASTSIERQTIAALRPTVETRCSFGARTIVAAAGSAAQATAAAG